MREKSCACTTCHVVVREGFESLGEAEELEEDLLDKAWGLEPTRDFPARRAHRGCAAGRGDSEIHHQYGQRGQALMKWNEVQEIAIQLADAHPEVDPSKLNFVDLMNWVIALPSSTTTRRCGERILEGIQQAWIEEAE